MGRSGRAARRSASRRRHAGPLCSLSGVLSCLCDLVTDAVALNLALDDLYLNVVHPCLARLEERQLPALPRASSTRQAIGRWFETEHVGPGVEVAPLEEVGELVTLVAQDHAPRHGIGIVEQGDRDTAVGSGRHRVRERLLTEARARLV